MCNKEKTLCAGREHSLELDLRAAVVKRLSRFPLRHRHTIITCTTNVRSKMTNSAADSSTEALIKALQSIQSEVHNAKTDQPTQLPHLLTDAMAQTSQLLASLPSSEAAPWLSELSALAPACIHEKPNHVPCIHNCGDTFCTPTCRRQHARQHAKHCRALRDAKLLRKLGLADKDLF